MREIKFRAWHMATKIMAQVIRINWEAWEYDTRELSLYSVKVLCDKSSESEIWHTEVWNIKDIELMQYIGLKDKSGKEIYEGDILELKRERERENESNIPTIRIIKFGAVDDIGYELGVGFRITEYEANHFFEIIGNIYENPELLGE